MVSRTIHFTTLMSLVLISFFSTCKDAGTGSARQNQRLSADDTNLQLVKGYSRQVTLSGGTQPYAIKTQPNSAVATAVISSALLTISAVDTGSTSLVVNDSSTPTADTVRISIRVDVTAVVPTVQYAAQVQPIFDNQCTGCHGSSGGLSLASGSSYSNLVNVQAQSSCTILKRVLPDSADSSVLYQKISGTACGTTMPQGGSLSANDITLIQTWINEGARNN